MHNPELYGQSNCVHKRDIPECLAKCAPKMKWKAKNNRIIDIGCGDGSVTSILEKFLPTEHKLLGCDISHNMVWFASNHYSNEQTTFTVMDIAGDLPKRMRGNYDYVFSFYALNWVIDQKRAFENIYNLMDDEGECFLILVAYNSVFEVYRTLSQNGKWNALVYDVDKYISPYHDSKEPDKEIISLMESIGFVDIDVECKDRVFLFKDGQIRTNFMTSISPFKVPENDYDEFMRDYLEVLDDVEIQHNVIDNRDTSDMTLHYKSVVIHGRKSEMYQQRSS